MNKRTYALIYGACLWGISVGTITIVFQKFIFKRPIDLGLSFICYLTHKKNNKEHCNEEDN